MFGVQRPHYSVVGAAYNLFLKTLITSAKFRKCSLLNSLASKILPGIGFALYKVSIHLHQIARCVIQTDLVIKEGESYESKKTNTDI
jgi:hypothetical protein